MESTLTNEIHPVKILFKLLLSIFVISISVQALALLIYYLIFINSEVSLSNLNDLIVNKPFAGKLMLAISSVATFILPVLYMQRNNTSASMEISKQAVSYRQFVLIFLILLSFMPLMSVIGHWNEGMKLPQALSGLEAWMYAEELRMAEIMKVILMDSSLGHLLLNLLVMAIIPAIGEELLFRGYLQPIFGNWFRNPHLAIWVTAIIFSAIHVQFFGFFPRLILGAIFGYFYYWSKNIWLPIFGHFINNAAATIMAFYYTRQGQTYEEMQSFEWQSSYIYIASFIFTIIFVVTYYQISTQRTYGKKLG